MRADSITFPQGELITVVVLVTADALNSAHGFVIAVACYVKPLDKLAVDTANGIGKVAVDLVGACKIPFAPDQIKKFEARSAIGKKRKSPKC
jgi:hypothetical protein